MDKIKSSWVQKNCPPAIVNRPTSGASPAVVNTGLHLEYTFFQLLQMFVYSWSFVGAFATLLKKKCLRSKACVLMSSALIKNRAHSGNNVTARDFLIDAIIIDYT